MILDGTAKWVWRWGSAAVLAGLATGPLSACEAPLWDPDWGPKKIRVAPDCAFDRGGPYAGGDVTGSVVTVFAKARIYQVITNHYVCTPGQKLLVVDCGTAEMIVIDGVARPRGSSRTPTAPPKPIANILRPRGAIKLNRRATVERLAQVAARKKYPFTRDRHDRYLAGMAQDKGFDPYCGCKALFPASAGAKQ